MARIRLTEPDTRPFTEAIQVASVSDILRVRLLSTPQAKQAPRTASVGHSPANRASPGQLRTTAPATMAPMPSAMRRSKFSLKTNHASSAVNKASALSRSEAPDAGMPVSPIISSTGPTIPPAKIAPANQDSSFRGRRTAGASIRRRYSVSPTPEPRYSRPANNHGLTASSSHFASGVPAPNNRAAPSAAATPGWRKPSLQFIYSALDHTTWSGASAHGADAVAVSTCNVA